MTRFSPSCLVGQGLRRTRAHGQSQPCRVAALREGRSLGQIIPRLTGVAGKFRLMVKNILDEH